MPSFGERSRRELATCHSALQSLFNGVIREYDCSVLCGRRGKEAQDAAFAAGFSKVQWPNSKHNAIVPDLSLAVDVVPYPIDWKDRDRFYHFAGYVRGVASRMDIEIKIRWGGDWDSDFDLRDQSFMDWPHFEVAS